MSTISMQTIFNANGHTQGDSQRLGRPPQDDCCYQAFSQACVMGDNHTSRATTIRIPDQRQ